MRAIRPMPEHRHYADGLINIGGWWAVNGLQGVPVSAYAQSVSPPTLPTNPFILVTITISSVRTPGLSSRWSHCHLCGFHQRHSPPSLS